MREDAAPAWDVNEWIAADPRWQNVISDAGGSGYNVFYPVQEEPESGFPYIRFSSSIYAAADDYWYHQDEIMYAMYFANAMHSNRAMNIIFDKVMRGDKSGAELEAWRREMAAESAGGEYDYNAFTYHSLEWVSGGPTQPAEERGGAHARLLTFRVWYTPLDI